MNPLEKLTEFFRQFPGIGPRQAKRFVYHLLAKDAQYLKNFSETVGKIKDEVAECQKCCRFFPIHPEKEKRQNICDICKDINRDDSILLVVSRDADFEAIEKSGLFNGRYFVLGGALGFLEKEPEKKIRIKKLISLIKEKQKISARQISEIILAMNANPEGEYTSEYLAKTLSTIINEKNLKISFLGRGMSTGSELEYLDKETFKNALKNRG